MLIRQQLINYCHQHLKPTPKEGLLVRIRVENILDRINGFIEKLAKENVLAPLTAEEELALGEILYVRVLPAFNQTLLCFLESLKVIVFGQFPHSVYTAFKSLKDYGIFSEENCYLVKSSNDPKLMCSCLIDCHRNLFINHDMRQLLASVKTTELSLLLNDLHQLKTKNILGNDHKADHQILTFLLYANDVHQVAMDLIAYRELIRQSSRRDSISLPVQYGRLYHKEHANRRTRSDVNPIITPMSFKST